MKQVSLAGLDVSRLGGVCMGMFAYYTGKGTDDTPPAGDRYPDMSSVKPLTG